MIGIRHKRFLLTAVVFSVVLYIGIELEAGEWKELKSEHFKIYFGLGDSQRSETEKFAKDIMRKAEQYYKRIAGELGYQRYSNFWTWDNRVKIYVYPDHASYLKATGQAGWSRGVADYTRKVVVSYRWRNEEEFLDALLPHELGHLVFRDFIGFKGQVPLWLDEGVAQWQEHKKRDNARDMAKQLLERGRLISLEKLLSIDSPELYRSIHGGSVHEFYVEAISLVDFLITRYGKHNFTTFCRQLRDGKSFNEALRFSYPTSIRTVNDLEKRWVEYIKE